jgi:hypothetical protein
LGFQRFPVSNSAGSSLMRRGKSSEKQPHFDKTWKKIKSFIKDNYDIDEEDDASIFLWEDGESILVFKEPLPPFLPSHTFLWD